MTIEASDRLNYFLTKKLRKICLGSDVPIPSTAFQSTRILSRHVKPSHMKEYASCLQRIFDQSFTVSRSHCSRCCPVNSIMPNIFMLNQLLLRRCEEKDYSIDLYKISGSLRFLSLLLSRRTPGQACR